MKALWFWRVILILFPWYLGVGCFLSFWGHISLAKVYIFSDLLDVIFRGEEVLPGRNYFLVFKSFAVMGMI